MSAPPRGRTRGGHRGGGAGRGAHTDRGGHAHRGTHDGRDGHAYRGHQHQHHHANRSSSSSSSAPPSAAELSMWLSRLVTKGKLITSESSFPTVTEFVMGIRHMNRDKGNLKLVLTQSIQPAATASLTVELCELFALPVFHDATLLAQVGEAVNGILTEVGTDLVQFITNTVGKMRDVTHLTTHRRVFPDVVRILITLLQRFRDMHQFAISNLLPHMQVFCNREFQSPDSRSARCAAQMAKLKRLCEIVDEDAEKERAEAKVAAAIAGAANRHAANPVHEDPVLEGDAQVAYRNLDVIPTVAELLAREPPNTLPGCNITDRPYRDAHHLLNTHVRLMKEDVVRGLREGATAWADYFARPHVVDKQDERAREQLHVYERACIIGVSIDANIGLVYRVSFPTPRKNLQWSRTSRLMFGSLVALTKDWFRTEPIWAEVFQRDDKYMDGHDRPMIDIRILNGQNPVEDIGGAQDWSLVEASQGYFAPYKFVIAAMQQLGQPLAAGPNMPAQQVNLPFTQYFVQLQQQVGPPRYLTAPNASHLDLSAVYPQIEQHLGSKVFNVLNDWPLDRLGQDTKASMDQHQTDALKHLLTKEVAVVIGPPGTGQT